MYNDKIIRCERCGNEVPVIPAPGPCRECAQEAKQSALDAALAGFEGMTKRGTVGKPLALDLIKWNHDEGHNYPIVDFNL